ncbi:nitrate/nitrite transporter NrtS [Poseidonibacter lekithochrous]|uniref:nitrate/nitrite transporter NrtS n=1 Tax=Poseidonibacter lekithochrous TaxID=1904463 RepID=UPI0008FC4F88|nr:nitrate/nitrite transporter NrtS [Poseidonibacter lekithochrous]QKJ24340.1 putative membrane protein [Poseidonibacter lekithochrous]
MNNLDLLIIIIKSKELIIRAIKIALIVGIILNIINQGDYIFSLEFEKINMYKAILTFFVPFFVSMYTAVTMKMKFHVGEKAIENITLRCKVCNSCKTLQKEEVIPFCDTCHEKTIWKLSSIKDKKCNHS